MNDYALVVNVDAVVVRDGEFLAVQRSEDEEHAAGEVAFPGGKVEADAGEDAVEATARREVAEEVDVDVGAVEYVSSHTFVADEGTECLNVVTACEYAGGDPAVREPDEIADVFWTTVAELREDERVPEYTLAMAERVADQREATD
jgi:8-oxo-dGTP diphosphatase